MWTLGKQVFNRHILVSESTYRLVVYIQCIQLHVHGSANMLEKASTALVEIHEHIMSWEVVKQSTFYFSIHTGVHFFTATGHDYSSMHRGTFLHGD